jgi:hypothetical protein
MPKEDAKINCPIFQKQELVIKDITAKINNVKDVLEKVEFAERLQEEVNALLCCQDYDGKSTDCNNCHFVAKVRTKTADLIIKAERLA